MTPRGTLGLLALLAVLVAYVAIVDRPWSPATSVEPPLLATPAARVTTVEITWPGAHLVGTRRDDGWYDQHGQRLSGGLVDDLLAALATVRPMETLPAAGATATEYGLGAAATGLALGANGTELLRLEVGDRNPAWTGVYVRRSGAGEVLVVGALLHWELTKLRATTSS